MAKQVDVTNAKIVGVRPLAVRPCLVTLTQPDGQSHQVQVEAEALYEAAVPGLAAFKQHPFGGTTAAGATHEIAIHNGYN